MIQNRLSEVEQQTAGLEFLYKERNEEVIRLEKELEVLTTEIDLLGKVDQTLQAVSAQVLGQSTQTIDQLVTAGLKSVFTDQKLEFRTVVDKFRGKTSIRFELFEDGQTAPLMDSFGGGVLSMIGVLLRVTTIIVLGHRRILFLDESLSHLSEQYVPSASAMLKKICSDLDFTVLMVTHEPLFAQHANRHYEAKKKAGSTMFEEQTGKIAAATA